MRLEAESCITPYMEKALQLRADNNRALEDFNRTASWVIGEIHGVKAMIPKKKKEMTPMERNPTGWWKEPRYANIPPPY